MQNKNTQSQTQTHVNHKAASTGKTVKSATAFRTISEVATELDVQQHVLRFWETRFSQIKPLKRGGGRRYYRPEDVELIRRIHHLLYNEGYTIRGVQKLLQGSKSSFMAKTSEMIADDEGVVQVLQTADADEMAADEAQATPALGRKQKQELGFLLEELKSLRKLVK
jgi:DNA-binding transcriptional MerR regulator